MEELQNTFDNSSQVIPNPGEEEHSSKWALLSDDYVVLETEDIKVTSKTNGDIANGDVGHEHFEANKAVKKEMDSCPSLKDTETDAAIRKDLIVNKKKLQKIAEALRANNVQALKKAAVEKGGLISDEVRRKVWPMLAGVDVYETSPRPTKEEIEEHPYYKQVILDVNRSLKRFPPSIAEKQRLAMQDQLVLLIMRVLVKNPEHHYYQGYHDICVTFLLVLGEEMAFNVVNKLSNTHLRMFMDKTMERTVDVLSYVFPIIRKEHYDLFAFMEKSEVGVMFSLSWLITWFGHVLNNYADVVRLFDLFLATHSWMPMYLSAAIVLYQEKKILEQECDMACVHSVLCEISDDLPFEELIVDGCRLYEMYPPKQLELEESPARELKKKRELARRKRSHGFVYSVLKSIQNSVPTSKLTISIVIAAAVVVYAVVYESYKT